eukprot:TRINITY_DN27831_c0_g1_i4.p1 TRINITY_DN27831_c0_g1~~TRINITY_DN27831_c0_g1_i4.p1  ORF type:complete len:153 (-),score=12.17 TRINITY_DN27831_c0_g1_i4:7-465(-)
MIRRPPRSTHCISSAASDVYKRQLLGRLVESLELVLQIQMCYWYQWDGNVPRGTLKKTIMELKEYVRTIENYPIDGISFKDITTLLKEPIAFRSVVDQITEYCNGKGITKIVSLESRGFIVGGAVAYCVNAGFVPIRKKGKLPSKVIPCTLR